MAKAQALTTLYNSCMELGKWPCTWKMEAWTPVFEKGDRQQAKNYCPTTSLVTIKKTFEHVLSKQVTRHYDPTLYQRMTAYRRHHSCQTTLLRLVEDWNQLSTERNWCISWLQIWLKPSILFAILLLKRNSRLMALDKILSTFLDHTLIIRFW